MCIQKSMNLMIYAAVNLFCHFCFHYQYENELICNVVISSFFLVDKTFLISSRSYKAKVWDVHYGIT